MAHLAGPLSFQQQVSLNYQVEWGQNTEVHSVTSLETSGDAGGRIASNPPERVTAGTSLPAVREGQSSVVSTQRGVLQDGSWWWTDFTTPVSTCCACREFELLNTPGEDGGVCVSHFWSVLLPTDRTTKKGCMIEQATQCACHTLYFHFYFKQNTHQGIPACWEISVCYTHSSYGNFPKKCLVCSSACMIEYQTLSFLCSLPWSHCSKKPDSENTYICPGLAAPKLKGIFRTTIHVPFLERTAPSAGQESLVAPCSGWPMSSTQSLVLWS